MKFKSGTVQRRQSIADLRFGIFPWNPDGLIVPAGSDPRVADELHHLDEQQIGVLSGVVLRAHPAGKNSFVSAGHESPVRQRGDFYDDFMAVAVPDAAAMLPRNDFPAAFLEQTFSLLHRFRDAAGVKVADAVISGSSHQDTISSHSGYDGLPTVLSPQNTGPHVGKHEGLTAYWNADQRSQMAIYSIPGRHEFFVGSEGQPLTMHKASLFRDHALLHLEPDEIALLKQNVLRTNPQAMIGIGTPRSVSVMMMEYQG